MKPYTYKKELCFPQEAIGFLYMRDENTSKNWDLNNCFEAKGKIEVPEGKEVKLELFDKLTQEYVIKALGCLDIYLVQELCVFGRIYTNDILKIISSMAKLKSLNVVLATIDSLEDLNLDKLLNLVELCFTFIHISHSDLEKLFRVNRLIKLYLNSCGICDESLKQIKNLDKLLFLSLRLNDISDKGIVYLLDLKKLQFLDLSGTQISDNGLIQLKTLSSLRELILESTNISQESIHKLRTYLPNCNIYSKHRCSCSQT